MALREEGPQFTGRSAKTLKHQCSWEDGRIKRPAAFTSMTPAHCWCLLELVSSSPRLPRGALWKWRAHRGAVSDLTFHPWGRSIVGTGFGVQPLDA